MSNEQGVMSEKLPTTNFYMPLRTRAKREAAARSAYGS